MPKFLTIVTNIDIKRGSDDFIASRAKVSSNVSLNLFFDTLPANGIVSIELKMQDDDVAEEEGWTQPVLVVPDLMRFSCLEKVVIDFIGDVRTSSISGEFTFPNRVWMFALRNATLCADLLFGDLDYAHRYPKTIIALYDASLNGEVNWQTIEGRNQEDRGLMLWTQGTVSFNLPTMSEDCYQRYNYDGYPSSELVTEIRTYTDDRGSTPRRCTELMFDEIRGRYETPATCTEMYEFEMNNYLVDISTAFDNPILNEYEPLAIVSTELGLFFGQSLG
jgi:hypothetical protein